MLQRRAFRWVILLSAGCFLIAFGVLGLSRGGPSQTGRDASFLYLAGLAWLRGLGAYGPAVAGVDDPWLAEASARYDFAYPPQIAPLCLLLAAFSPSHARWAMAAINVASAVALAAFSARLARDGDQTSGTAGAAPWLVFALVLGSFSTAFVTWAGQTTLIVTLGLMAGWYYTRRGQWVIGGLLLAVSTIKPQLSVLAILWLVLERRWLALGTMAAGVSAFAAVPISVGGPVTLGLEWIEAAQRYAQGPYNTLGSRMIFSLQNVLYLAGLPAPNLLPLALLPFGVLWHHRSRVPDGDVLGFLVGLSLVFGFGHSYDLAGLTPLVPAFWRHVHGRTAPSLLALGLMLVITFPNSVLETFVRAPLVLQARVFALMIALVWLAIMGCARVTPGRARSVRDPHWAPSGLRP